MNQVRRDRQEVNPTLSDAELRAAIYFAVGVTSESGNRAYMLAVAGDRPSTPRLEPADNSGYSIGTIQTDLGQHYQPDDPHGENVPQDLVIAYQAWATRERPQDVLNEDEVAQTVSDLGRNGRQIKAQAGRALDATVKSNIDSFLASDEGITWVHGRDVEQVNKLMRDVVPALQQSDLYKNASLDDQVRLAVIVSKAYNQNERLTGPLLAGLRSNRYEAVSDVNSAVDGLSSRPGDYFESGRDRAMLGANIVNSLRSADGGSPLRSTWDLARDNALINPTQLGQQPDGARLANAYPVVRNLFVQYDQAPDFVDALNRGGTHAYGRGSRDDESKFAGPGMYAAGNDFVVWNASGKGDAYIDGSWQSINRSDLVRAAGPRGVMDIGLETPTECSKLLLVDPNAPQLRPAAHRGDFESELTAQSFAQDASSRISEPTHAKSTSAQDLFLQQSQAAVRRLDASMGREYDEHSACMAASAACLAKTNGLSRIDHVVLSGGNGTARKGENLFVVQGALDDPAHHWAHMKTQDAVNSPVEKSVAQLQTLEEMQRTQAAPSMQDPEKETTREPRMG